MQSCLESGSKSGSDSVGFVVGQRVHFAGDTRRIGTVKYVGAVEGYDGNWVGVDWDNGDGKHDGSHNGVRYFEAQGPKTASFVRPHNLSSGVTLVKALEFRYHGESTKEEEDEMYVLSATNKKVSIELLGKDKIQNKLSRFEELTSVSLAFLGVSSAGPSGHINTTIPSNWIPPMSGWYKLNIDGAAKSNPGGEVLSGIIRDCNGNWKVGLSKCIPFSANTFAEISAVFEWPSDNSSTWVACTH